VKKRQLITLCLSLIAIAVLELNYVRVGMIGSMVSEPLIRTQEQLDARIKFFRSFLKAKWELSDYPLRFREQAQDGTGKFPRWKAQIVNWGVMIGLGSTKDEAYANLQTEFDQFAKSQGEMPRPGAKARIRFAPTREIDKYAIVANGFFGKILGRDYRDCFVSDQSSLWDFCPPSESPENFQAKMLRKIKETYGCDVSDIKDGNLVTIFERLQPIRSPIRILDIKPLGQLSHDAPQSTK
jgi:hypothetical protein